MGERRRSRIDIVIADGNQMIARADFLDDVAGGWDEGDDTWGLCGGCLLWGSLFLTVATAQKCNDRERVNRALRPHFEHRADGRDGVVGSQSGQLGDRHAGTKARRKNATRRARVGVRLCLSLRAYVP